MVRYQRVVDEEPNDGHDGDFPLIGRKIPEMRFSTDIFVQLPRRSRSDGKKKRWRKICPEFAHVGVDVVASDVLASEVLAFLMDRNGGGGEEIRDKDQDKASEMGDAGGARIRVS